MRTLFVISLLAAALLVASPPAHADFHLMQIQQVIGGVNGDATAQAVQLRMRSAGQGGLDKGKLMVYDATGRNPVVVIDFLTQIFPELLGGTVLIASQGFGAHTSPPAVADYTMTSLIPASYLAAGSLTYENNAGQVLWRLSWGGSAYRGTTTGLPVNDANGFFGPPYPGPLPSDGTGAVVFRNTAPAPSTTNAHDYTSTDGAAVFTNIAGQSFVVGTP